MRYRDDNDTLPGWAEDLIQNLRDQVQELQAALFIADMELAEERERNGAHTPQQRQAAPIPRAPVTAPARSQRPQLRLIHGQG